MPVRVRRGGSLVATGARVTGQVTAIDGATVELFDSTITGPVRITGSTQRVAIAGSQISGPVTVSGNATGTVPIVIAGNRIVGLLACTGNQPAPVNGGHTNDVTGPRSGQCAML